MDINHPEFDEILTLLEKLVEKMEKFRISDTNIRGKFAELYVANKLKSYSPQSGSDREITSADIYLSKLNKRVEVKSSILKDDYWDWAFGFKQLKDRKFDYCVLIGLDNNGKIAKTFVLTYEEIKNHPLDREESLAGTNTYLMFSTDYINSEEYKSKESQIELDLNFHPEKYENCWNKIK